VNAQSDILIGGPHLAAQAFREGLIDEFHLCIVPVLVGGGKRSLPRGIHLELDLLEGRGFNNGMIHLCCQTRYAIDA
jgi:dihydrofolate reductase